MYTLYENNKAYGFMLFKNYLIFLGIVEIKTAITKFVIAVVLINPYI